MKKKLKNQIFKNKQVLLIGLGILGGGLNLAKWLIKHGANLTITDLKNKSQLKKSLEKLADNKEIKLVLGKHRQKDILENDIIVLNQDVQSDNKFLKLAEKNNKQIEDELTLFAKDSPTDKIIAITGTRGKTTTNIWTAHILQRKFKNIQALGNSPDNSLIANMEKLKLNQPVCLELPSCLLEQSWRVKFRPKIAVIANLFQDHLNRYNNQLENYAKIKANIFKYQKENDYLILNFNDPWTKFFLKQKPKAQILFFSLRNLPVNKNGVFIKDNKIFWRFNQQEKEIMPLDEFVKKWGEHNLSNLLPVLITALIFKLSLKDIKKAVKNLPQIKFRQELVFKNKNLKIYNDTAATSPEATTQAVKRFAQNKINLILISGGTDANLDYKPWAQEIKKYLKPEQIVFLQGSATQKMIKDLRWQNIKPLDNLDKCVKIALNKVKENAKNIILFSPGAKSFEKFNNEFDRGEKFNQIIKKITLR